MIPYDIDPSLHDHEPGPPMLDDGFSPPAAEPARGVDGGDEGEAPTADSPRRAAR